MKFLSNQPVRRVACSRFASSIRGYPVYVDSGGVVCYVSDQTPVPEAELNGDDIEVDVDAKIMPAIPDHESSPFGGLLIFKLRAGNPVKLDKVIYFNGSNHSNPVDLLPERMLPMKIAVPVRCPWDHSEGRPKLEYGARSRLKPAP